MLSTWDSPPITAVHCNNLCLLTLTGRGQTKRREEMCSPQPLIIITTINLSITTVKEHLSLIATTVHTVIKAVICVCVCAAMRVTKTDAPLSLFFRPARCMLLYVAAWLMVTCHHLHTQSGGRRCLMLSVVLPFIYPYILLSVQPSITCLCPPLLAEHRDMICSHCPPILFTHKGPREMHRDEFPPPGRLNPSTAAMHWGQSTPSQAVL